MDKIQIILNLKRLGLTSLQAKSVFESLQSNETHKDNVESLFDLVNSDNELIIPR